MSLSCSYSLLPVSAFSTPTLVNYTGFSRFDFSLILPMQTKFVTFIDIRILPAIKHRSCQIILFNFNDMAEPRQPQDVNRLYKVCGVEELIQHTVGSDTRNQSQRIHLRLLHYCLIASTFQDQKEAGEE